MSAVSMSTAPSASMCLDDPSASELVPEVNIYTELLSLDRAVVVELGCGRAEHTRAIATAHPAARIVAFEVDRIQYDLNRVASNPPNLEFRYGGAEAIEVPDGSVDVVMMFKSLHHVPVASMDEALREVARVLRPGGVVYFSEPVFAGEYNEIVRIYHNEQQPRQAAFDAIRRAVDSGALELVTQRFFLAPVRFKDFAEFEAKSLRATHANHQLSDAQFALVRQRFDAHIGPSGTLFKSPMRIDLLRKPANDANA